MRMAKTFLLDPEGLVQRLAHRYRSKCREWLRGEGEWPLVIKLGQPSEEQAMQHCQQVRAWQESWAQWRGSADLQWSERRWSVLGSQRLPESVAFDSPQAVATALGEEEVWSRAIQRFRDVTAIWPQLIDTVSRDFEVLAQWPDVEFERLLQLLRYLSSHPASDLYVRQLPVPGMDSKWLDKRQKVVCDWLQAITGVPGKHDLFSLAGLRRLPVTLRVRLLDPSLGAAIGGIRDLQAPVTDLATLELPIRQVLVVENLQTGLALKELPGAVVFMGQGYAVEPFGQLPWLRTVPSYYWGDLDTHGFVILDRLRKYLPHVQSLLMDKDTLLHHRPLWVEEDKPATAMELPRLFAEERALFADLQHQRWGTRVRLEQERIDWEYAMLRTRWVMRP